MRRLRRPARLLLAALALAAWGAPACFGRVRQPGNDREKVCARLVTLRAADGVRLDGIVYEPAGRARAAAILLVHGFGGNFYEDYFPALGRAAARHGYRTLALNMRDHGRGPKVSDFADNRTDIAAGLAYLRDLGHHAFVLLGQSMGTNRVLFYQAASGDPSIAATVLVSGPGDLFEWNVWQFGRKKAQATVEEALARRSAGRENELMLVDLGPLGKALYTPRYLLSLRGPEALSDPYRNIARVRNPILIVQGGADRLIQPDIGERLERAARGSRHVDFLRVPGANHAFSGHEDELAGRILSWLGKQPGVAP
jgi:pimeloyl-ACP methyl ester carboxylesterase